MSGIGTGYDLSATTYSPDGKVFQTEYAQKAVDNTSTVIGLRCKDGVVLAAEKLILSKLLVEGTDRKIFTVDRHAGVAVAGLVPDGRMIVNRGAEEAGNYKQRKLTDLLPVLRRPFGATTLLATYDKTGPQLHVIEPSGNACRYFGTAVGKGRQAAKNEIEKLKLDQMTCAEAVVEAVKILYKVHDEDGKPFEIEMSWISDDTKREHQRVPKEIVAEAVRQAKAAMEESDMDDE